MDGLTLHVRVDVPPERTRMVVRVEARNTLDRDVYWLNRPWRAGSGGVAEWDERGPCRSEQGGLLRLLYGIAPLLPGHRVTVRYIPHATRIEPGASASIESELAVPVDEHTIYGSTHAPPPVEIVEARSLAVLAHWVTLGPRVSVEPSPIDEGAFNVHMPLGAAEVSVTQQAIDPVPVRRRKDTIARILLPAEMERAR